MVQQNAHLIKIFEQMDMEQTGVNSYHTSKILNNPEMACVIDVFHKYSFLTVIVSTAVTLQPVGGFERMETDVKKLNDSTVVGLFRVIKGSQVDECILSFSQNIWLETKPNKQCLIDAIQRAILQMKSLLFDWSKQNVGESHSYGAV